MNFTTWIWISVLTFTFFGYNASFQGIAAAAILLVLFLYIAYKIRVVKKKWYFHSIYEDIYVVSKTKDGRMISLKGSGLEDAPIFFANYGSVNKKVEEIERWLNRSKNPDFLAKGIKVKATFFKHGEGVNYTFEEYEERTIEKIKKERKVFHVKVESVRHDLYIKHNGNEI